MNINGPFDNDTFSDIEDGDFSAPLNNPVVHPVNERVNFPSWKQVLKAGRQSYLDDAMHGHQDWYGGMYHHGTWDLLHCDDGPQRSCYYSHIMSSRSI